MESIREQAERAREARHRGGGRGLASGLELAVQETAPEAGEPLRGSRRPEPEEDPEEPSVPERFGNASQGFHVLMAAKLWMLSVHHGREITDDKDNCVAEFLESS